MKTTPLTFLTTALLAYMGFLLVMSIQQVKGTYKAEVRIHPLCVKSSYIEMAGQKFFLNFEQQQTIIDCINQAEPWDSAQRLTTSPIQSITLYCFEKSPLAVKVLGHHAQKLVFTWQGQNFIDVANTAYSQLSLAVDQTQIRNDAYVSTHS